MTKKYKKKSVFIAFFLFTSVFYFSTQGAGMVFDFNSWLAHYETGTYKDVLNSFGYPGLHQMEQFAFFSLFKLFGYNHFGWYLSFVLLHSFTAFVGFKFLNLLLAHFKVKHAYQIALFSASLFLISPMAADTVVNKVTVHYFLSAIFIYSALYFELKYYVSRKKIELLKINTLFILALFSLEIAYIFPMLFVMLWFALNLAEKKLSLKKTLDFSLMIPFIILGLFLLLHKLSIGSVVGHYGAEVHTQFIFSEIFSNALRYFLSYAVFFEYFDYGYKDFASVQFLKFAIPLFILVAIVVLAFLFKMYKKNRKYSVLLGLSLVLGFLSLAPISNLYYAYLFPIENDRYGYLASLFFYFFIVLLLFLIKKSNLRKLILLVFFGLNIFFLIGNINTFSKSSQLAWNLLNDFRWFEEDVIILVDPQSFGGAKMFGTETDTSSFAQSLFLHTQKDRRANVHLVYQMNYTQLDNTVVVEKRAENQYKVTLAQWGNWFWKNNQGAASFENDLFKLSLNRKGRQYFVIDLKEKAKGMKVIYPKGDEWFEVIL